MPEDDLSSLAKEQNRLTQKMLREGVTDRDVALLLAVQARLIQVARLRRGLLGG